MVDRPLLPLVGGRAVTRPGTGLNTETTKLVLKVVFTQQHVLSSLYLPSAVLGSLHEEVHDHDQGAEED